MRPRDDPFWEFERTGWDRAAPAYDASWSTITRLYVEPLLDAAGVERGTRLLDVACGPGHVSEGAQARGAVPVGTDVAAGMLQLARERLPGLEFVEGDAHELGFPDAAFDAVTMSFGIHHLARPQAAFAEARRVLRPGGGYAFTSWAHAPDHGPIALAEAAVEPHADSNVELPPGPEFLQFSDRERSERALVSAGFDPASFRFETVRNGWRLDDPGQFFYAALEGGVRMAALLRAQSPERLERIRAAVGEAMEEYADGEGGYALPVAAHVVSARVAEAE